MEEEFYAILKLVSGEELFSLVLIDDSTDETILVLQNPITIKVIHSSSGSLLKVKPWMDLTEDDIHFIKLDKVITMTESNNEKLIELYNNYLEDDDSQSSIDVYRTSGQVKVSEQKGYISSVDSARDMLEKIFKGIKES